MANQQPQLHSEWWGGGDDSAWFSQDSLSVIVAICLSEESKKRNTSDSTCQGGSPVLTITHAPGWQLEVEKDRALYPASWTWWQAVFFFLFLFFFKKKHKLSMEGCGGGERGKCNELMLLVGICLLTQRKRWLSSKIFLLLWYQLLLGFVYKSWDCQQNKTRFLLMVVNVQASWNNRDFDISSAKATLVLLFFPAWALGLKIMASYR